MDDYNSRLAGWAMEMEYMKTMHSIWMNWWPEEDVPDIDRAFGLYCFFMWLSRPRTPAGGRAHEECTTTS